MLSNPGGCGSVKLIFRAGDGFFHSVHGNSCFDSLSGAFLISPNAIGLRHTHNQGRLPCFANCLDTPSLTFHSCRVSCKSNLSGWFDTSFQINIALQHHSPSSNGQGRWTGFKRLLDSPAQSKLHVIIPLPLKSPVMFAGVG